MHGWIPLWRRKRWDLISEIVLRYQGNSKRCWTRQGGGEGVEPQWNDYCLGHNRILLFHPSEAQHHMCGITYLQLGSLRTNPNVIALLFTLIFRPFSQPCHPHTRLLLSLYPCYLRFPPCFHVINLLFNSWTFMTWWLYPSFYSYSSFTLIHSMKWGPDRFPWDFWWLYAN